MGAALRIVAGLALVAAVGPGAMASEESARLAEEALRWCDAVSVTARDTAGDRLEHGTALAEAAVAADEQDARAHLALFCNLGKQVELAGLSWRVLRQVSRVRATIARATELAPDDPDVLVAHGELLRRLPRPLGGDPARGLTLLERALARRPDHVTGRLYLARALAAERRAEARRAAREARAVATQAGATRERDEAEALLASLETP